MTDTTTEARALQPGELLHVLSERGALIAGEAYRRGDTFSLTAQQIENTRGRDGASWTDDISPAGQAARWGTPRFGIGEWPEGEPVLVPGSVEHELARQRAREEAYALPTERLRAEALREVAANYGKGATTSTTVGGPSDPQLIRERAEEHARRRAEAASARPARRVMADDLDPVAVLDAGAAAAFTRTLEAREILGEA